MSIHAAKIENSPRLQRLLAVLNDGQWHSTKELTLKSDNYAVSTSIQELKAPINGLNIESNKIKTPNGEDYWEYRLVQGQHKKLEVPEPLQGLAEDLADEWEERAAIMKYDGGLSIGEAEQKALAIIIAKAKREAAKPEPEPVEEQMSLLSPADVRTKLRQGLRWLNHD